MMLNAMNEATKVLWTVPVGFYKYADVSGRVTDEYLSDGDVFVLSLASSSRCALA